jgi:glycerol-3-phosphate dehydrogenase (NAD(P)+)
MLGEKGIDVSLWARNAELIETMNAEHRNTRYLVDLAFSSTVSATNDLALCLKDTEAVVLVTPSSVVTHMAAHMAPLLGADVPLVLLSKGIEGSTGSLLLDVLGKKLGFPERLAVLSGPNHAEEVARGIPSATVVASTSPKTACTFQELFVTQAFRVYTSEDTIGVQINGAAKNILAIACGLASGLGYGDNTLAMLMTRGLAEISRLVVKLGGDPLTCMGLAGVGDLIATCYSQHSRNRSFGLELAAGGSLEAYQQRTHMVVEGALACKTVTDLARKHEVDMPISSVIRSIVWDKLSTDEAIALLLDRSFKPEFY